MERAKLLLKASKELRGSTNSFSRYIFLGVVIVFSVICFIFITLVMLKKDINSQELKYSFFLVTFVLPTIAYGCAMSVYSAFTKIQKEKARNNFKNFSLQLPVTEKDYLRAQYLDLVLCIFPGILCIAYTVLLGMITHRLPAFQLSLGISILYTSLLFLITCMDKGLSSYFNIQNSIKELVFCFFAISSVLCTPWLQKVYHMLLGLRFQSSKVPAIYYFFLGLLEFLGSPRGIFILLMTALVGYWLCCKLPFYLRKLRGDLS